jgi:hypothetical protein
MVEALLAGLLLLGAVLFGMRFAAGYRLSQDPRQHELAALLVLAVMPSGEGPLVTGSDGRLRQSNGAPLTFLDGFRHATEYVRSTFPNESPHHRRLRLAHALSLAQRYVSNDDYGSLKIQVAHFPG